MRIISEFNDYYDIGVSYGVDPNIIYKREEQTLSKDRTKELFGFRSYDRANMRDIINKINGVEIVRPYGTPLDVVLLGFCGKWYFGLQLGTTFHWHWSDALAEKLEKSKDFRLVSTQEAIKKVLRIPPIEDSKAFMELKAPIIKVHNEDCKYNELRTIINPCLKDMGFSSVIDPWTAFQEIDMFVSGVLGQPQPDTASISDKDLRDAKGFDNMSFKKAKTKGAK